MLLLKRTGKDVSNPQFQPIKIELVQTTTRIGRSADHADIVMDSRTSPRMISRMHAQITRIGSQYYINCTGMNGMLVNSVKRKKCKLNDGDIVVFGGAGVQTSEGSVISKLQSELVYVFQSQENVTKEDEKGIELKRDGSVKKLSKIVENQNNVGANKLEDSKWSQHKCGASDCRAMSTAMSDTADQYSPGEGTSDGSVLRKTKISRMMPYDSDDDDDEFNKSGYSKQPLTKKADSHQSPNELINDDNNGRIVLKRKKRAVMPFDSDDDSINSPVKKLQKTESLISKSNDINGEKSKSEIKDKEFLDDLNEELLCCICRELLVLTHALPCSHTFCYLCIRDWLRRAQDCPSCRAKAAFDHLVPVKVLDNTVEKVASRVLSPEHCKERKATIQQLQDKINGRMDSDTELNAEYGHMHNPKEHCEKCNLPISNRLLRWVLRFPKTSSTASYHLKCFKPPQSVTMSQIKNTSGMSKADLKKIRTIIRS